MPVLPDNERQLRHALDLARDAAAFASPNPTVGCVLTRGGDVIGTGAHDYDAVDHAEIAALKSAEAAGHSTAGATAYVTLEPCSHHGRTGPCADALIRAGVARCVVATADPNPAVSGGGLAKLRAAGIDVDLLDATHPLAVEARRLNDAFAFSIQHGRPFVTLKAAVSRDGMIAPPPHARTATTPFWLTGEAARADVQQLRHASDAILVGIGTVLADDPTLTDRTGLARRRPLLRVVFDSHLRTPLDSQLVRSAADDLLLVANTDADEVETLALIERGVTIVNLTSLADSGNAASLSAATPQRPIADPFAVLEMLQASGIRSVLLEGGAAVHAAFLRANLVDRVVLYRSAQTLGPGSIAFANAPDAADVLTHQLHSVEQKAFANEIAVDAADTCITGYLHDPWAELIPNL